MRRPPMWTQLIICTFVPLMACALSGMVMLTKQPLDTINGSLAGAMTICGVAIAAFFLGNA